METSREGIVDLCLDNVRGNHMRWDLGGILQKKLSGCGSKSPGICLSVDLSDLSINISMGNSN